MVNTNTNQMTDADTDAEMGPIGSIASTLSRVRDKYDRALEPLLSMLDSYFPFGGQAARLAADQLFFVLLVAPALAVYLVVAGVAISINDFAVTISASADVLVHAWTTVTMSPVAIAVFASAAYIAGVIIAPETESKYTRLPDELTTWRRVPAAEKAGLFGLLCFGLSTTGVTALLPAPYGTETAGAIAALVGGVFTAGVVRRAMAEESAYARQSPREQLYNLVARTPLVFGGALLAAGGSPLLAGVSSVSPFLIAHKYTSERKTRNSLYKDSVDPSTREMPEAESDPMQDFHVEVCSAGDEVTIKFHDEFTVPRDAVNQQERVQKFINDAERIREVITSHYAGDVPEKVLNRLDELVQNGEMYEAHLRSTRKDESTVKVGVDEGVESDDSEGEYEINLDVEKL